MAQKKQTVQTPADRDEKQRKQRLSLAGAAVFWLLIWQAASLWIGQEILLVSPVTVLKTLGQLIVSPTFWRSVGFSFVRIVSGFTLAWALGVGLAVAAAWSPLLRKLLTPLTATIKATPVASFIILALVWIPSRNLSVFISFLMVLPIVYINCLSGILQVDRELLEMARVFRVPLRRRLLYIYLPDVMPFLISAASVSLGLCWKSGIAAEVIGLPTGSIGERLYEAKIFLQTGELFAWTVVIILVSVAFEKLVLALLRMLQQRLERTVTP
ncbi:MAG: ABC transporter permease subunit [Clostridia bacterium]|nr:ABC transporter permease subunit [Clostridia bacterium]